MGDAEDVTPPAILRRDATVQPARIDKPFYTTPRGHNLIAISNTPPANPADPVHLPEFGVDVSWAMCRNTCCRNFGIHYRGASPIGGDVETDRVGRFNLRTGKYHCKACKQSFELKSNLAIREIARYFLPQSLPFADCSDPTCLNHGVNIFEHHTRPGVPSPPWPPDPWSAKVKKGRRYRAKGEHSVHCRGCEERFPIGTALGVHQTEKAKAQLLEMLWGFSEKRSVSQTINRTKEGIGSYYSRLDTLAGRLRDYLSWQNAQMLKPGFWRPNSCARIYTDDIVVSLRRHRSERPKAAPHKLPRQHLLKITVSVVGLDGTYYILAAHPHYLPINLCPTPEDLVLERRQRLPRWASPWSCLWHEFDLDDRERQQPSTDIGLDGRFIREDYAHLAHFLAVGKMLSRCPRIHHYVDGSKSSMAAARIVFADRIKAGTTELVVFQHKGHRGHAPNEAPQNAGRRALSNCTRHSATGTRD